VKDSKSLPWIAGTAFLAILILAFAWFVVVSPARESTDSDRQQAEQQDQANALLAITNAGLAKEFANLDQYKAELADAHTQIPATIDQPAFSRELDALATRSGVWIKSIAFSTSMNLADSAPSPQPSAEGSSDSSDSGDTTPAVGEGDASGGGAAATVPPNMYGVPVSVTVIGSPDDAKSFVNSLQTGTGRLVLVTGISLARQTEQASADGLPAIKDGDFEETITGLTYLLQDTSTTPQAADSAAADG